ncbi:amidohydrolase [Priestia aryabhattai]
MKSYLIKNSTVYPVSSPPFKGDVLLENGKIKKLSETIQPTKNDVVIDASGQYLFPGLIDVHTHLGMYNEGTGWAGNDANETTEAITPHIRALDGVYPMDIAFSDAVESGVTCAHIMPGSANIIGGTTSVIKTYGKDIDKMLLKDVAGLKIALGENPKKTHSNPSKGNMTRMGVIASLRETFINVLLETNALNLDSPRYSSVRKALKREIPIRVHAHRTDDIISAIRLAEEFNLDLRIEHCTEGHLISEEIKERVKQVSVGPTLTRKSKVELKNKSWDAYSVLSNCGIEVSITTDHPYIPIQCLNVVAALAVREGLSEDLALKGITLFPAKNLGVDKSVGSIEEGKDADVVIWSDHLFNFMAKPQYVWINGDLIYSKEAISNIY